MARAAMSEIVPGLFQRGNFHNWPRSQKWRMLEASGITMVVNVWHKVDPDLSADEGRVAYLVWPVVSTGLPKNADSVVDFLAGQLAQGEKLLVHCEAGVNRSSWLCARLLMAWKGMSREEAWATVKKANPSAELRPELEADLRRAPSYITEFAEN